jgi:hypothetical protein
MTELAPAETTAETTDQPPAAEQRPGSGDQARYPSGVTAADTDPNYYDGDIKAALAADTTPTRQQAAREDGSDHQAPGDTTAESPDTSVSGHAPDIEAILHENDDLPEPRTRQEAARDDPAGQAADATATESHDPPASRHAPDVEAILHENDNLPEPHTRQEAAREAAAETATATRNDAPGGENQQSAAGPDPLTETVSKDRPVITVPAGGQAADRASPRNGTPESGGHDQQFDVVQIGPGERTFGDTTPTGIGLKPTGDQLRDMENEEASKPEKLRRKFLEGIDDINDAARDNAGLGHDLLMRNHAPAGHAVTEVPHPLQDVPHEGGGAAPDITSAGLVAGVLLIEATRRSREPIHRITEKLKGQWPWR